MSFFGASFRSNDWPEPKARPKPKPISPLEGLVNLDNPIHRLVDIKSDTIYVLIIEIDGRKTLVLEPGTGTIYRSQNKQVAESYASTIQREEGVKCAALTFREAWRILSKEQPGGLKGLEDSLMKRMEQNLQRNTGIKPPHAS
jgi:hypothetical protein